MTTGKIPRRSRRQLFEDEVTRWMHSPAPGKRAKKAKKKPKKKAAK
jgi:hypothetical protein